MNGSTCNHTSVAICVAKLNENSGSVWRGLLCVACHALPCITPKLGTVSRALLFPFFGKNSHECAVGARIRALHSFRTSDDQFGAGHEVRSPLSARMPRSRFMMSTLSSIPHGAKSACAPGRLLTCHPEPVLSCMESRRSLHRSSSVITPIFNCLDLEKATVSTATRAP